MSELVLLNISEGIATITLNDPERRNAQSAAMGRQFADCIRRVRDNADVRVLVVTGAGRAFCAGGDLGMLTRMLDEPGEANRQAMLNFYRDFLCVAELEIPTIAAINGAAIGAGISLALAFDLRVAALDAKLGFTYINLGLHPGMATHFFLPRLIGVARAYELIATGKIITGAEGADMGLVNSAVPAAEVMPAALQLARALVAQPAGALRTAKRVMYQGLRDGLEASLAADAMAQALSYASPEMRRRLTAGRNTPPAGG